MAFSLRFFFFIAIYSWAAENFSMDMDADQPLGKSDKKVSLSNALLSLASMEKSPSTNYETPYNARMAPFFAELVNFTLGSSTWSDDGISAQKKDQQKTANNENNFQNSEASKRKESLEYINQWLPTDDLEKMKDQLALGNNSYSDPNILQQNLPQINVIFAEEKRPYSA